MPLEGGLVSPVRRLRDRELIGPPEARVHSALVRSPTIAVRGNESESGQSVEASSALQSWKVPPS
ncbi:hypothetical protein ABIC85_001142 [Oerskovia enterophila]